MRSGEASSASVSVSRDFEMSQFWQKRQARLQPAVPKEKTDVPGRKWFRGFFSMGSTQKPLLRPYVVRTIAPPRAARTKQWPSWPSFSRHSRGQTSHWIRPSWTACQWVVGCADSATEANVHPPAEQYGPIRACLLYTSDAADEEDSVDLG